MVKSAVDAGINFFDMADVDSFGDQEAILGNVIKKLGLKRHELIIVTKVRSANIKGAFEN